MDFPILGSADRHMACAFIGEVKKSRHHDLHPSYKRKLNEFEKRCEAGIKHDVGYVDVTIAHAYHGPKAKRGYSERWAILINNQFNPDVDIFKDSQGLWQLADGNIKLRDALRRYFRSRHEDCIAEGTTKIRS
jgi:hypothetical protein